ncbi:MAG: class I SAM-dependent methyltransferase [Myxococcales bacterium]|nr:class I SAM-dependent methyltransferase [Myxococcales bacterium]
MHRLAARLGLGGLGGLVLLSLACRPSEGSTTAPEPASSTPEGTAASDTARAERTPIEPSPQAQAIVDAADRPERDRAIDVRRRPAELLTFLQVEPGMRVADLMAGSGYTTELLSRSVGPEGVVFAQNNAFARDNIVKGALTKRLERDVLANVVEVAAELEDPLPPEAKDLDLVTICFSYHDAVVLGADTAALNRAVFDALAPGGRYVVLDHAAPAGTPASAAKALHRLDEALVVQEVTAAGFERGRTSDFLRDPSDDMTKAAFGIGFQTDRFVLEFIKPKT